MNAVTMLGGPLTTPQEVAGIVGTPSGAQLTVIYQSGAVLKRTDVVENDWTELSPVPLSARAGELRLYGYNV